MDDAKVVVLFAKVRHGFPRGFVVPCRPRFGVRMCFVAPHDVEIIFPFFDDIAGTRAPFPGLL